MAAALGPCIQEAHAMVGQRHVARHRHEAPADQPRIRDGVVWRATRTGRDQRRAVAGEASDAVDTRGLNGLGIGYLGSNAGRPARPPRLARSRVEPEETMVRTPAQPSAVPPHSGMRSATTADVEPGAIHASPRTTSASHLAYPLSLAHGECQLGLRWGLVLGTPPTAPTPDSTDSACRYPAPPGP
jgi:hypothetical protein